MNKFWGRNEHGSAPRFSRDDEQILALNYENLCDGDYLNRLFSSDMVSAISEEATGADAAGGISGSLENGLFSAELPEDFIVFGNDKNLGRAFAKIRFNRQLVTSLKNQDAVTAIVNRQAVVFEHISKLMIDRCTSPAASTLTKETTKVEAQNTQPFSLNHMASSALDCCLILLEHEDGQKLRLETLEPLISMVFQINQEAIIKARFPQLVLNQPVFSTKHVGILRNVLSQSAMRCLSVEPSGHAHSHRTLRMSQQQLRARSSTEESFRTSLASFYGLLALGLHTRDASEILVAIAHLMAILQRAEEWCEQVKSESKVQLTQALSLAASAVVAVNNQSSGAPLQDKGVLASATSVPPKMPPKLKNAQHNEAVGAKGPAAKTATGRSTPGSTPAVVSPAVGVNVGTVQSSPSTGPISPAHGLSVVPSTALITLPLSSHSAASHPRASPSGRRVSEEHRAECATEEEVSELALANIIVPSNTAPQATNALQPGANTHNSSNPNMKAIWEKQANSKLPADPVALHSAHPTLPSHTHAPLSAKTKINSKMSKAEARVIQEILDPNMYTAQELSAYYASNPSTVNYVFNNNNNNVVNNNHNEESLNPLPRKITSHNNNNHPANKNNNQPAVQDETNNLSSAHNNTTVSTSQALILRHKKNIRGIKDSIQELLKVPKPMLKVLYDSCAESERNSHTTSTAAVTYGTHSATSATHEVISPGAPSISLNGGGSSCNSTYVWSCGQNSYGELGLGDSVMRKSFTRVSCLDNKIITSIGAGNEHSLFVTNEGKLYTSGYNDNGQCGTGTTAQVRMPSVVTALEGEEVSQVHVYNGCEHTIATTRDGKVFSFGYNYRGQLGLGSTISEFTPRQIRGLLSKKVIQAACSYHHSFMLCSDGSLYSCGRNDSGQLGHGDCVDKKTPQCLNNAPQNIISISCGQFHSVLSTTAGVAYACGKNDYGQLGLENLPTVKLFTQIVVHPDVEFVSQVCCGYYHTLLLSNTGVVAGFGRNDYGQLGLGHAQQKVFVCTPIVPLRDKNVRTLAAGCYHSIIITANGMLYVFGRNNHGQLATGDTEERHSPHPVDNFIGSRVLSVAAGFYHTIVLTTSKTTSHSNNNHSAAGTRHNTPLKTTTTGVHSLHTESTNTLLKDAALLTGIKATTTKNNIIVPFALDRKSRVGSRELLLFLVNHVESLVTFPDTSISASSGVSGDNNSDKEDKNSSDCHNNSTSGVKQWVTKVLCCVTSMLEMCTSIVNSAEDVTVALPLSADAALTFVVKLVKMVSVLLQQYSPVIVAAQEYVRTTSNNNNSSSVETMEHTNGNCELYYIYNLLNTSTTQSAQPVTSASILSIFESCTAQKEDITTSSDSGDGSGNVEVYNAVSVLRRKLFAMYFSLPPRDSQLHAKHSSIVTDIATSFAHNHTTLLPSPLVLSQLFLILKSYTLPGVTVCNVNILTQTLCLRLLAVLCATYRSNEEVISIFQQDKVHALVVFRCMLNLYGHFSMHSLVKRFHTVKATSTSPISSVSTECADVRRLITVLEHSISNFVKCAMPVMFSSASPTHSIVNTATATNTTVTTTSSTNDNTTSNNNTDNSATTSNHLVYRYGVLILQDVLSDAGRLIDYVLQQQSQSDETLGQLRYGTIMPSILPSILIYGISFCKHRCVMLEIVPDVSKLLKKLQLIGKSTNNMTVFSTVGSLVSTKNVTSSADKKHPDSLSGSIRHTMSQIGTSISHAIDTATHTLPHVGSTHTASHTNSHVSVASHATSQSSSTMLVPYNPQEEECEFDETTLNKTSQQWYYRLIKICNMYVAKMSAALICPPAVSVFKSNSSDVTIATKDAFVLNDKQQMIAYHSLFRFVQFDIAQPNSSLTSYIAAALGQEIEENRASEHVVKMCNAYRDREKATDAVYKMLSQSTQSMFSTNIFNLIEESLLECVVILTGTTHIGICKTAQYFKLISRFTKRVHSKRSVLVTNSETSWVEVLMCLCNVVKLFATVVVKSELCVHHSVPLILPFPAHQQTEEGPLSATRQLARRRWRRAVMLIVCMHRWQAACVLHYKQLPHYAVDFVTLCTRIVTDDFAVIPSAEELSQRIEKVFACLQNATNQAEDCARGIHIAQTLLADVNSHTLRCDVLCILTAALRERALVMNAKFEQHAPPASDVAKGTGSKPTEESLTHFCTSAALWTHPTSLRALYAQLVTMIGSINLANNNVSLQELSLLSHGLKLLQLSVQETPRELDHIIQVLPLNTLQMMLQHLRERQKATSTNADEASNISATTSSSKINPANKKHPASLVRDRNAAYRRATADILQYLQILATSASESAAHCQPYHCAQLIELHNCLIATYQQLRMENLKHDAICEEAARCSVDGSSPISNNVQSPSSLLPSANNGNLSANSTLVTTTTTSTSSSSTILINTTAQKNKNRRCQDLITKPMEFCRNVEGFVVNSDKLLNSYKGVDYTMACWMHIPKKCTKNSFITGKLNHSDAWPLIVLRPDHKLEIIYGHNNEFEKMTSSSAISSSWTHIAVIVEAKKIKLFLNGALDCSVTTAKGNSRAFLYPLLIGAAASAYKTKNSIVKEGFDGMLAQFKYYSRALQPIHVKIVYDSGPPENGDISNKLIYMLLSSLKCLLTPLHSTYVQSTLQQTSSNMHLLFVTDGSRRTRFAALHTMIDVLCMDCLQDMHFYSHIAVAADPQQCVLVSQCTFLDPVLSFKEKIIVYLLTLAGACWAPHVLARLEKAFEKVHLSSTADNSVVTADKNHHANVQLVELLRFTPHFATHDAHHLPMSASFSGLPPIHKKESRNEMCNQVVKALIRLSQVDSWKEAMGAVITRVASAVTGKNTAEHVKLDHVTSSALSTTALTMLSYATQLQTIALSLLLGGGTEGTFVGAYARNFFSDVAGVILNINKTTNFVTLLCHNTQHGHQQIVKVRLNDIIITSRRDVVRLDIFPSSVIRSVVDIMRSVCGFCPMVLSDYMCTSIADSALHRVVLKSSRPMEVFLFAQLLHAVTSIHPDSAGSSVLQTVSTNPTLSPLLHTLQQASMATLTTTADDAVHHLGDNRTPYTTASLAQLFHNAHAFLLALPERTKQKVLFSNDEIKTLCECVSKHFNMSTDCILEPTQSNLMKQGRLSELVQFLSLENNELIPNLRDMVADFVQQTVSSTHSSGADQASDPLKTSAKQTDLPISNLVSEWPASFVSEYPSVCSDSTRNDVHCVAMMALLLHLRTDMVLNARTLLNKLHTTTAGDVNESNWTREVVVWQSLAHSSNSHVMSAVHSTMSDIVNTPVTSWESKCAYLYTHKRVETTQMLALSLRYFALSLLQLNVFKSADNMYESVDLFNRTLSTVVSWVDYAARSSAVALNETITHGAEVSVTLLKLLLPTLSFIDNGTVALQLTQLCTLLVRKLAVQLYHQYTPSRELMDLAKSNNFTLLRARAQEQVIKYKTHKMGNVSPLAYNLTQLVSNLELVQRLCSNHTSEKADTGKSFQALLQKLLVVESTAPKVTGIRAASVDADLTLCAEAALAQLLSLSSNDTHDAAESLDLSVFAKLDHIMVEVALGTNGGSKLSGAVVNVNDIYFETVYCGASMRFVQSGLVPECTYYLRSRVYVHNTPLLWSAPVEFKTSKGVLFTFDSMKCGPDIRLRDDGLSAVYGNDDAWSSVLGTRAFTSGVTHWDIRINSSSTAYVFVGVASSSADLSSFLGGCPNGWGFIGEQALYHNREKVKVYGESFVAGDIVGVTLDLNNGTMSFQRNHKSLGVAFDHIFGELYPAVAFYNVGQEIEILTDGFSTTCSFESIPTSPCRLNFDEISTLNELALSLYTRQPLSHRLCVLVAEQCNVWCAANHIRARAVSGRDVYLNTQSALLAQHNLIAGERVRTPYGVAEVAGTAYNKVWFVVNPAGEVWYFTVQQVVEGRAKKMFLRCSYEGPTTPDGTHNVLNSEINDASRNVSSEISQMTYDHQSIVEHIDPSKWSPEMDALLLTFLQKQCDSQGADSIYAVTSQCVTDNFRSLQQQFSRIMMENAYLSHRWGISGPKRRAVLARIGLIRMLNQYLGMYLPFVISDHSSKVFVQNQTTLTDDFAPVVVSLKAGNAIGVPTTVINLVNNKNNSLHVTHSGGSDHLSPNTASCNANTLWCPPENHIYPLIHLSFYPASTQLHLVSTELARGPVHALRSLVFNPLKMAHFHEIIKKSTTRAAKTEDDYDYPDDLPHVKINRLKSFRAREASELLLIPGEDLMLSSMFCQLYRELRQYNDEKLRISYTHPMDDGQSRTFKIKFEGEGVDDYGGPYREIFQQICEEIQSTDPSAMTGASRPSSWAVGEDKQQSQSSGLNTTTTASQSAPAPGNTASESGAPSDTSSPARCFLPLLMPTPNWVADGDCTERYRYMFHPAAESPLKMDLYHFLGQLVGIAVRSKITLDLALPSYIWKYVVCEKLTEEDIASFDAPAFTALQRLGAAHQQYCELDAQHQRGEHVDPTAQAMLQYNLLELIDDLTWSYTRSDGVVCELIPGRGQARVELTDVEKYLVLYAEARLTEGRHAIGMFRRGLVSILPESALSLLKWDELQAAVCGPRVIDITRLKDNTEYDDDISSEDPHIVLFWEVLSTFSEAQKSSFLRFVWARPTLPPKGVEFTQKMRVLSAVGEEAHQHPDSYLPKAHTCFFSLNLPKYTTKEIMSEKLLYAITNCTEMDADFRTTEVEVVGWGAAAGVPHAGSEF